MHDYEVYQLAGRLTWLVFAFAFGACAGSLINVLVYRLPRGMSVVTPPSRCPACENLLTWRENIPVFGWLFLKGRCRFCKSHISAEYPLVEAFVGGLLCVTFFLWYQVEPGTTLLSIPLDQIRPEWAMADARDAWPRDTWPLFVMLSVLLALLVAITLVDAKTFTIPLQLPWTAAIVGLLAHVGLAGYLSATGQALPRTAQGWIWSTPTPGGNVVTTAHAWWWIGASIGGTIGIGVGIALLEFGLIRRSFADYAEWEERAIAEARTAAGVSSDTAETNAEAPQEELKPTDARRPAPRVLGPLFALVGVLVGCAAVGAVVGDLLGTPRWLGLVVGAIVAPVASGLIHRARSVSPPALLNGASASPSAPEVITESGDPAMWIAYPHARREMLKELLFLTPCLALGWGGGALAVHLWTGHQPSLWLLVLAGVLMGALIGGGVIWGVRILGSLAFGKEAMGLGDVHLMAGVGACVGWIDAALALPMAAFVGLYWTVVSGVFVQRGQIRRTMPFGPFLTVGVALMIFAKPLVERGLSYVLATPVNLP